MFSYLVASALYFSQVLSFRIVAMTLSYICWQEHILETQDKAEADRIMVKIEECKKTLLSLGYIEFTFEDFFAVSLFNRYFPIFPWVTRFLLGWDSSLFAQSTLSTVCGFVYLWTMIISRLFLDICIVELADKLSDISLSVEQGWFRLL